MVLIFSSRSARTPVRKNRILKHPVVVRIHADDGRTPFVGRDFPEVGMREHNSLRAPPGNRAG